MLSLATYTHDSGSIVSPDSSTRREHFSVHTGFSTNAATRANSLVFLCTNLRDYLTSVVLVKLVAAFVENPVCVEKCSLRVELPGETIEPESYVCVAVDSRKVLMARGG